jgi:hypothetical protein
MSLVKVEGDDGMTDNSKFALTTVVHDEVHVQQCLVAAFSLALFDLQAQWLQLYYLTRYWRACSMIALLSSKQHVLVAELTGLIMYCWNLCTSWPCLTVPVVPACCLSQQLKLRQAQADLPNNNNNNPSSNHRWTRHRD